MNIVERIKTKPGYKVVGAIIIVILLGWINHNITNSYIKHFKNGDYILQCDIKGEWKTINPDKIVGFDDETGAFIFTNGYAKNCEVIKVKNER